ncbi:hypothetical protein [Ornithinibacillus scapharcae]|uniref:hypothetical protein n=1 Tax=Ornithinibacillus scapharcae TaxID=1147159 RepID=UPI000225B261|nr:hypothetical protein [Ornithinibacillus scapharcae]
MIITTVCWQTDDSAPISNSSSAFNSSETTITPDTEESLTLNEAIDIAQKEALKWNKEALLYNGLSVDRDETPTGMDGRRKNWNIKFGIPYKTDLYLVTIRDGKIWGETHLPNELESMPDSYFVSDIKDFKFDSPELLEKSKKVTNIYPGDTFAKGYNYGFTKDPEKNIPLSMVIGWDESKKVMIYLQYNAKTGELENKIEREQYKN